MDRRTRYLRQIGEYVVNNLMQPVTLATPDHNLTSADVYFERGETILNRRRQIKLKTIATAA
jgi:hypothetical protein